MSEAIEERLAAGGVYETPGGDEGLFITTIHALVQTAAMSPAMGRRKVLIVGDADRMVSQEGSDQAANAFLKLLEEPPADTTVILTSSEPGALLPTIQSRVVSVRVAALSEAELRAFLADPAVSRHLDISGTSVDELIHLAGGAPGRVIGRESWQLALRQAKRILDAATTGDRATQMHVMLSQGTSGARGKFSDTLDALTVLLHERTQAAARTGNERAASGFSRAVEAVEVAKELAYGNVNPQLLAASLVQKIAAGVR
jgi:DNA polymerase III subunit delta'